MELGYGSEYQLFRCLGHHRHEFDGLIRSSLGIHRSSCIDWLDFPADHSRRSGDGEWKSIQCFRCRLQMSEYERLEEKWRGYWPSVNMAMNWDAVFRAADVWYFVEAQAHVSEMESKGPFFGTCGKTLVRRSGGSVVPTCKPPRFSLVLPGYCQSRC